MNLLQIIIVFLLFLLGYLAFCKLVWWLIDNSGEEPKIRYIDAKYLPVFRAIMIPHVGIFIKKKYEHNEILHQHELIHWKQYKRMGSIVFLIRYMIQFITIGYDTMPFELEARQTDSSMWNYRERNWKE